MSKVTIELSTEELTEAVRRYIATEIEPRYTKKFSDWSIYFNTNNDPRIKVEASTTVEDKE